MSVFPHKIILRYRLYYIKSVIIIFYLPESPTTDTVTSLPPVLSDFFAILSVYHSIGTQYVKTLKLLDTHITTLSRLFA